MKPWEETWEAREVGGTWQVRMPEQPPHRAWLNVHPIGEMDCPHPDEAARARLAAAAPEMARLLVERYQKHAENDSGGRVSAARGTAAFAAAERRQAMTLGEFREVVQRKLDEGLAWIQIVVERKRPPSNWSRVRWVPGVYGRCIGEVRPGEYLFDLPLADVAKAIGEIQSDKETRR